MKKEAETTLNLGITLRSKWLCRHQKKGTHSTEFEVVNCLLDLYATDDFIADAADKIMRLTQFLNETLIEYAEFF